MAYQKTNAIFATPEKKTPGAGGVFSIFVSDLCKGCAACVTACGEHQALRMVQETEDVNAEHETGTAFLDLLPDTSQKYLGLYNDTRPQDSKTATLRNMLMVRQQLRRARLGRRRLRRLRREEHPQGHHVGHRSLHAPALPREGRPVPREGRSSWTERASQKLAALKARSPEEYDLFRQAVAHLLMGLGGEDDKDTQGAHRRSTARSPTSDIVGAMTAVMRQEAFNHKDLQAIDGRLANGMSVMAMAAHTGCNTVYGSTPPNNPHPYPWMNSLFQDGITVGWLLGESFIVDHGRRSVVPERLADALLQRETGRDQRRASSTSTSHFSDAVMTDQEILELPKAWVVGGDGGMGDIGYQNTSKVILQNRPNVKAVMLDTQVYSNTGGQNSDSTPMLGGNDMNVFGAATQGKNVEKKTVAETFLAGHGSPFVAQVSIANAPKLYKAILDGLEYRGTAFLQCFTTCQPEHGVADDMALTQAQRVRDSRGAPEFVFNPRLGETYQEALDLKGNPSIDMDWYETKFKSTNETVSLHRGALVRHRGAVPESPEEDQEGRRGEAHPAREHARPHHAAGRRVPPVSGSGPPLVRAGLRRLHQGAGGQRRRRVPVALAPARALLRRAPQGVADAAEQGGHREPGIQGAALAPGRRRRRQDLQGRALRARRGAAEGADAERRSAQAGRRPAASSALRRCRRLRFSPLLKVLKVLRLLRPPRERVDR